MAMLLRVLLLLLFWATCLGWSTAATAQRADSVPRADSARWHPPQTLRESFVARMQVFAKKSAASSADDFKADKAGITQDRTFERIKQTMQKAGFYLKNGIDTTGFKAEKETIDQRYALASDGVFTHKGPQQTFRNLTATAVIVGELLATATVRKQRLERHQQALTTFKYALDSLLSVPDLFAFPQDSATLMKYLQKIRAVAYEIHPVDSALTHANRTVRALLNETNIQVFKLQTAREEIEFYQQDLARSTHEREFPNLWEATHYPRPFAVIARQAWDKGRLTLLIYSQNNWEKVALLLFFTAVSWVFIRSLKGVYLENKLLERNFSNQLVLRYPLLSALLLTVCMLQFLFISPPFLFSVVLWLVACTTLTVVFRGFISAYWMRVWLGVVGLFLLGAGANLLLQASRGERWFMLAVSMLGAGFGWLVVLTGPQNNLRERWMRYPIGLMALLELGATTANLFGRYNLAKTLLISGFLNVVVAILFLWTVRLIDEGLFLAFNVYREQGRRLFFLNFNKVGSRSSYLLYVFLVVGWTVLVGRNFPGFSYISGPLKAFLTQERAIGEYSYTIISLTLFITILALSVLVSRVVSFFTSDRHPASDAQGPGLGSWVLPIRITILTLGVLLAFGAAGFPLDRLALILGALGVGIGFGLQTLVNNLVSGLIIAFEKPLNVGDIIEVEGQQGKVKSIGFRSSVITNWDGADVVMPNGDVLNSHLVNWTLGGHRKRLTLVVGVAYGTDLKLAKELITNILDEHPVVFKTPPPVILFDQFNTSSIDIKIYFWNRPTLEAYVTKSELIAAITNAFGQRNIVIPFPQQDVYYHFAKDAHENDATPPPPDLAT